MFFDTFEQVKKMNKAGFSQKQSEAVVNTMGDLVKDKFVTKQDMSEALKGERIETSKEFESIRTYMITEFVAVREEMRTEFSAIRLEIAEIKNLVVLLEKKMMLKFMYQQFIVVGIIVGVLVKLPAIWKFLG